MAILSWWRGIPRLHCLRRCGADFIGTTIKFLDGMVEDIKLGRGQKKEKKTCHKGGQNNTHRFTLLSRWSSSTRWRGRRRRGLNPLKNSARQSKDFCSSRHCVQHTYDAIMRFMTSSVVNRLLQLYDCLYLDCFF